MSFLGNLIAKNSKEKEPLELREILNQADLVKNQFETEFFIHENKIIDQNKKILFCLSDRTITAFKLFELEENLKHTIQKKEWIENKIKELFPIGWDRIRVQ